MDHPDAGRHEQERQRGEQSARRLPKVARRQRLLVERPPAPGMTASATTRSRKHPITGPGGGRSASPRAATSPTSWRDEQDEKAADHRDGCRRNKAGRSTPRSSPGDNRLQERRLPRDGGPSLLARLDSGARAAGDEPLSRFDIAGADQMVSAAMTRSRIGAWTTSSYPSIAQGPPHPEAAQNEAADGDARHAQRKSRARPEVCGTFLCATIV